MAQWLAVEGDKAQLLRGAWWTAHERGTHPHQELLKKLQALKGRTKSRIERYRRTADAYGASLAPFGLQIDPYQRSRKSYRLRNLLDTYQAQLCRERVLPMAISTGGTYGDLSRARQLSHFLEGLFEQAHVFDLFHPVALDALVFGTGIFKVWSDEEDVHIDRIPPWDLRVDELASRYGTPREMTQTMLIDRYKAFELFASSEGEDFVGSAEERERIIANADLSDEDESLYEGLSNDHEMIVLYETIRTATAAGEGRRAIYCNQGTLLDAPYTPTHHPFVFFTENTPIAGILGDSVAERMVSRQDSLERLDAKIDEAHTLMGVPRILVPKGSKISLEHINDEVAGILMYEGQPPVGWNAEPIHGDTYNFRRMESSDMGADVGISDFVAQQQIPAGLKQASGVALQHFTDVDDVRHTVAYRNKESCMMRLAEYALEEAENVRHLEVFFEKRGYGKAYKFQDVKMAREEYRLAIQPTSALSQHPSAKFDQLMQLMNSGLIDATEFRKHFYIPDVDAANTFMMADSELIDSQLQRMVDTGEYFPPEPFDSLDMAVDRARRYLNLWRRQEVEEDRLQLIRQYLDDCKSLMDQAKQANAPPPPPAGAAPPDGMPPGPPPGPPGPPPGPVPPPEAGPPPMGA